MERGGTFVPVNESSLVRKFQLPWSVRRLVGLCADSLVVTSVVRYRRYLGKYRDTECDDTSVAEVTGITIPWKVS